MLLYHRCRRLPPWDRLKISPTCPKLHPSYEKSSGVRTESRPSLQKQKRHNEHFCSWRWRPTVSPRYVTCGPGMPNWRIVKRPDQDKRTSFWISFHDAEKPVSCPLSQLTLTFIRSSGTNRHSECLKRRYSARWLPALVRKSPIIAWNLILL